MAKLRTSGFAILSIVTLALLISGGYLARSLWSTSSASRTAGSSSVDLTAQRWYARRGFVAEDAGGITPGDPGVRAINAFPILLNTVFKIAPARATQEFTLMVMVDLDADRAQRNLMLSLPQIGDNWAVFFNGTEIRREIFLDPGQRITVHRTLQNALIPIPQSAVRVGSNRIVFHFIGQAPSNPWVSGWQTGFSTSNGYSLGEADFLIGKRTTQDAFAWLQIGVYIFFGLVQFFLCFRQKEAYAYFFGIFLFSCALYSFSYSNVAFHLIADTAVIYRMMLGVIFLWPGLVGLVLWSYFYPKRPPELLLIGQLVICLMMSIAIWRVPFEWAETLLAGFLPFVIVCAVYILKITIQAVQANVRDARKVFIASCFVFILIFWTVLDIFIFRTGVDLIGWTPFFLAFAFALIFIDRLWQTTIDLTDSNRQISLMRDNMESQVIQRTHELSVANIELVNQLEQINNLQASLREMALRDALTGLYNRRYLAEALDREFALLKRKHVTSLATIDIDHFKAVNDTYGHTAGDLLLKELSKFMLSHYRQSDLIFRTGGEEFLVVLPEARLNDAVWRTDELRAGIEKIVVDYEGQEIRFTISAGVVEMEINDETPENTVKRADAALYGAKAAGRNRVEVGVGSTHI
jgi:diguanylate cyclase (GGDEF)-like protein